MPPKIPKEDVKEDIARVAEELGKPPSRNEYDEHGKYSGYTAENKFETWTDAKRAAGLEPGHTPNNVPKSKVVAEIKRVADLLGESPSQPQFNEHAKYTHQLAVDRFGSWNAALEACDLQREFDERVSSDEIVADIQRVATEVDGTPSQADYHKHGNYGLTTVKRRFDQWTVAVRKAGFEPNSRGPGTGADNPSWRGGYEPYYGENWYAQRRATRKRDDYQCQHCGMTDAEHIEEYGWELEVHHIRPVREFDVPEKANDLTNLITLCRQHHRYWEEMSLLPRHIEK